MIIEEPHEFGARVTVYYPRTGSTLKWLFDGFGWVNDPGEMSRSWEYICINGVVSLGWDTDEDSEDKPGYVSIKVDDLDLSTVPLDEQFCDTDLEKAAIRAAYAVWEKTLLLEQPDPGRVVEVTTEYGKRRTFAHTPRSRKIKDSSYCWVELEVDPVTAYTWPKLHQMGKVRLRGDDCGW